MNNSTNRSGNAFSESNLCGLLSFTENYAICDVKFMVIIFGDKDKDQGQERKFW